jgi:hypothetical protein
MVSSAESRDCLVGSAECSAHTLRHKGKQEQHRLEREKERERRLEKLKMGLKGKLELFRKSFQEHMQLEQERERKKENELASSVSSVVATPNGSNDSKGCHLDEYRPTLTTLCCCFAFPCSKSCEWYIYSRQSGGVQIDDELVGELGNARTSMIM